MKIAGFLMLLLPLGAQAQSDQAMLDLTQHWVGYSALILFALAYVMVMAEEVTDLRKSKPVMLAAGVIWGLIAWYYQAQGIPHVVEGLLKSYLIEYGELMLFLLVAMTFINVMEERNVFAALRSRLISRHYTYKQLFWLMGALTFFIAPFADNLATVLMMAAVAMAVGINNPKFVTVSCINIVVAANAGGTFSPFGDITTLMIWQKNVQASNGYLDFWSFFALFFPSLIAWLIPALCMSMVVSNKQATETADKVPLKRGARMVMVLFFITIILAIAFHSVLQLPPVMGMLCGMSLLQFHAFYLKKCGEQAYSRKEDVGRRDVRVAFDFYRYVAKVEWDTLFFFYGIMMCVAGLGLIGYLGLLSQNLYGTWGATTTNIALGLLSAVVDNVPVMFTLLTMMPDMSVGQWLLATLTAGIGGSLLAIGSSAGTALMAHARGIYTFGEHLKWTPVIALGYAASVGVHFWMNEGLF